MRFVLLLLACLTPQPALADAVTYTGTLGGRAIVLEMTEPADGAVAGRFAFLDTGESIPLNPRSHEGRRFVLVQEGRCKSDACRVGQEADAEEAPVDAVWELVLKGRHLNGVHRPVDGSANQPIEAREVGRRSFSGDPLPLTLFENTAVSILMPGDIDLENAHYELALADLPLVEARRATMGDAQIAYMVDPRSQFAFPRVLSFADGSAPDTANAILARRHTVMTIAALDCLSGDHIGFGANWGGTLGDYDSEKVELTYASPLLVSWYEAGSLYCGGAHPYNHSNSYTHEVASGRPLDLSRIFADWEVRNYAGAAVELEAARAAPDSHLWYPSQALIDFVRTRIAQGHFGEAELDDVCLGPSALRDHLTIRFEAGPRAVFTLAGFPHVLGLCNGDLLSVPMAELRGLLTDEAARYLPELAGSRIAK